MSVELVVGDGGTELVLTFKSRTTGELHDLTARTVSVQFRINGGALQTRTAEVLDQATQLGRARYRFAPTDLTEAGTLTGQGVIDAGTTDQLTSLELFNLPIRAAL